MALFYPDDDYITHLLLIQRKIYPGIHSGQIGFPGGRMEKPDKDIRETALRETSEEVGVLPEKIEVIRSLTKIFIPPSNFEVQPFIGLYKREHPFVSQEAEVEALVEVPLTDFMDDRNLITQNLSTSYARNIDVPAFRLNGHIVWGATAMMLSEIKEIFNEAF